MMNQIKIAIADDQVLFREGLAALLQHIPDFELLFEAEHGAAMLEQLAAAEVLPDIALLDIEMPVMDGVVLQQEMQQRFPQVKAIMLSVNASERLTARLIHNGASGYLLKNCGRTELETAIRTTYTSGFYLDARVLKAIQTASRGNTRGLTNVDGVFIELSEREREVLQLICQELTNAEIAEKLFISPRTAEGHRNNLLLKTGCRNTAGLVLFAIKHQIFEPPF
jgi:DNA-binding NarL/FixJ family response regulator